MAVTDDVAALTARRFGRTSFVGGDRIPKVGNDPLPPGPGAALSALDRDLVDDVVVRMVEVAHAFPVGTVLGRGDGGVVVRRPAPVWAGVEAGG